MPANKLNKPIIKNKAPMTTLRVDPLNRNIWINEMKMSMNPILIFIREEYNPRSRLSVVRRARKLYRADRTEVTIIRAPNTHCKILTIRNDSSFDSVNDPHCTIIEGVVA
jgi:hypothetical protein